MVVQAEQAAFAAGPAVEDPDASPADAVTNAAEAQPAPDDDATAKTTDSVDPIKGRPAAGKGKHKGAPPAAILSDRPHCHGIQKAGWNVYDGFQELRKLIQKNEELRGRPALIKKFYSSVLSNNAEPTGREPDIPPTTNPTGGEPAEDRPQYQPPGVSNRLIRKFGCHHAFLAFLKPELAPKTARQRSPGRRPNRFIPHHTRDSTRLHAEDADVDPEGAPRPPKIAMRRRHSPPEQSKDHITKWVARWQLCLSPTWPALLWFGCGGSCSSSRCG